MKKLHTLALVAFTAAALAFGAFNAMAAEAKDAKKPAAATPAAKAPEIGESGWTKRCNEKNKKDCEIFKLLQEKNAKARVIEFALGFPKGEDLKKGEARGAVILPLGILLEEGVVMKVDEQKPLAFKARYCINAGCFAFVNLDKDVLETMKSGKTVSFFVKSMDGQGVRLVMNLQGFGDALKEIE